MAIPITTVEKLIDKFKSRGLSFNYDEIFLTRLLQFSTETLLENLNQTYQQYQLDDKLFAILLVIHWHHPDGVKPSQVSELTNFSRVQVSRCVETLVANGLVERQDDANDRRSHCLILTNKGTNFLKNELPPIEQKMVAAWQIISQEERQQLRSILTKLLKHLTE
ncbi:MarR family transcriptional regulator [Gilliamella sp. wkB171]|uniref:MarR family transcriptional regulator n=1 Tax=Gilliamella sp. wkB171 TaxID=3120258 RepID=UPI0008137D9D|nr:MarR family transcriptional regulator [Gilliamella apicola]OCL19372.1 hypothetical protein A9G03_06530 [Gilliamella apicola]